MKISFKYEIKDIGDISLVAETIKRKLYDKNLKITSANLYFSLKDEDDDAAYVVDENGCLISYIIREKPMKKTTKQLDEIIDCNDCDRSLYVYRDTE